MWVLTTLVKVSNFTNEVYDLHYVSSIIAEAINCSEFWTLTAFHTWSLSRIRPKCGAYWATGAVAIISMYWGKQQEKENGSF